MGLRRISDLLELRNLFEELLRVNTVKIDVDDCFKEIVELSPFIGVSKSQVAQA
jgi:hypothetical protein